jgi:hypothetical protein
MGDEKEYVRGEGGQIEQEVETNTDTGVKYVRDADSKQITHTVEPSNVSGQEVIRDADSKQITGTVEHD